MLENRTVFVNGDFVAWDDAKVHIMCHSFGRGSAIFEVLSLHETPKGPAVFRLDEHIERLFKSARLLEMDLPLSPSEFQRAVLATVRRNGLTKGYIKIIGFYPQISFDILPPQERLDVSIFVVNPDEDLGGLEFPVEKGTTLCISKWRKLDPQTVPVEAKAAANYLNGMLARTEARKRGFEHVVMLDTKGFVAEGGTDSIFMIKEGQLLTPALGTILEGITRKSILELADIMGVPWAESRLPPTLLYESEEVFLSGTTPKVLPVRRIEDRILEGTPGPLTQRLSDVIQEVARGKDPRFQHWLVPVG
jgi:branched-chain amino acid aminotransferase